MLYSYLITSKKIMKKWDVKHDENNWHSVVRDSAESQKIAVICEQDGIEFKKQINKMISSHCYIVTMVKFKRKIKQKVLQHFLIFLIFDYYLIVKNFLFWNLSESWRCQLVFLRAKWERERGSRRGSGLSEDQKWTNHGRSMTYNQMNQPEANFSKYALRSAYI